MPPLPRRTHVLTHTCISRLTHTPTRTYLSSTHVSAHIHLCASSRPHTRTHRVSGDGDDLGHRRFGCCPEAGLRVVKTRRSHGWPASDRALSPPFRPCPFEVFVKVTYHSDHQGLRTSELGGTSRGGDPGPGSWGRFPPDPVSSQASSPGVVRRLRPRAAPIPCRCLLNSSTGFRRDGHAT